jgi:hypothetical protein
VQRLLAVSVGCDMGKFIEFEEPEVYGDLIKVPEHIQESFENYFMYGWHPGGFVSAMLAGDLFAAANSADFTNGHKMKDIAQWIQWRAPPGSYGSHEKVQLWINDVDNRRSRYAHKLEQDYIVKTLKA